MISQPSLSSSVVTENPSSVSEQLPFPSTPYRGIEHYRFVDHRIFFARQAETIDLVRSVMIYKGMVLFGSSGAGKSSIINAGLLPRLIEMDFAPERIRVQNVANGEITIERISLNDDGKAPYLSPSLANGIADDEQCRIILSLEEFDKRLRAYAEDHYPLLILDQFEEIITLFEETPREPGSIETILHRQERLIDFFVGLLHDPTLRCKILFSFREDYLAKLTKLFKRAPELPNQYMRLHYPQKKALRDIIVGPLKPELQTHYERQQEFSQELIDELQAEFKQRADGDAINLSEVQIVCLQLWESDDPVKLFIDRRVQGLLEDYLTNELDQLSDEHRSIAFGLLSHMLTVSNTRNFVSGVELIHMFQEEEEDVSEETLRHVLIALTGTRLVRRELRNRNYFYEIASEFIVPKIIEKKTERQTRRERCRLEAEREKERRRAQQKLEQKNRLLALGILVTVLSVALATVMFKKRQQEEALKIQAEQAKVLAVQKTGEKEQIISILRRLFKNQPEPQLSEKELAQLRVSLATDKMRGFTLIQSGVRAGQFPVEQVQVLISPLANNNNPQVAQEAQNLLAEVNAALEKQNALKQQVAQDKLNALHEMRTLMRTESFPAELVLALLGPTLVDKNSNPEIAKAAQDLLAEASASNRELEASITAAANSDPALANRIPPRVYVQIESQQQSNQANAIKAELEKNGYIVPDYETVGSYRAPANYELRYYKRDDEPKALELVDLLLRVLQLKVTPKYLEGHENSTRLRPGHYELWMARKSTSGEDRYLVINAPAADERLSLLNTVSSITQQEGGTVEPVSRNELLIGPYTDEQVKTIRQRLIDQDPNLGKKGKLVIIKR